MSSGVITRALRLHAGVPGKTSNLGRFVALLEQIVSCRTTGLLGDLAMYDRKYGIWGLQRDRRDLSKESQIASCNEGGDLKAWDPLSCGS